MAKVKCNLARMKSEAVQVLARSIVNEMAGNPIYASLQDLLPPIQAAGKALEEASNHAAFDGGRIAHVRKRACLAHTCALIADLVPRVQIVTGGDATRIMSLGFDVRKGRGPSHAPETPQNLRRLLTGYEGMIMLRWKMSRAAQLYQVQMQQADGTWAVVATTTRCAADLEGLTSGTEYTLRVAAFGVGGSSVISYATRMRAA